jgi:biopolymer transport protein ExbD
MTLKLMSTGPDRFRVAHNGEINVTPFVDVMLVLLIIFMVAMPLATTDLKLDLPPARESAVPLEPTIISLQADGALFIGESPTTLATLGRDLAAKLGKGGAQQQIYVRGQPGVRYGAFLAVVDRLHADQYRKVGLVNEEL